MNILNINYIYWLLLSAIFFTLGEYISKKFALNPKTSLIVYFLIIDCISSAAWLPAILQRNQLSIVGTMWSVISLMMTVLIGVLVFSEKLSITGIIGIIFSFIGIILLSIG